MKEFFIFAYANLWGGILEITENKQIYLFSVELAIQTHTFPDCSQSPEKRNNC